MQVNEVKNEGLKREYQVIITKSEIAEKTEEKFVSLAKDAKLPGFRPGHVPLKVIRQRYAKNVAGEILEQLVNESSHNVLHDRQLTTAHSPKIAIVSYKEGEDLEYKMECEIMPQVPEIDFSHIAIEKPVAEADEKEIGEAVSRIADSNKNFVKVESGQKAEKGNQLVIDFVGRVDGVEFEGGAAKGANLELGSGTFIPGFEDQLMGSGEGDDVLVKVTFPETYHKADLAGKSAEFDVHVHEIRSAEKNGINDELAKKLGFDDLPALREAVKKQIESGYEDAARMKVKKQLFDALDKAFDFEVPESMFSQEFDAIWKNIEQAKKEGDEAIADKSDDDLRAEYTKIAKRRVKLGIVLSGLAIKNKLQITKEELSQAVMQQARQFPGQERFIFDFYHKNPERLQELHGPIMEEKTVDLIIAKITVNERKVSAEELLKEEETASDTDSEVVTEKKTRKKAANA